MDYTAFALRADACVVPEGKAGSYGHRALLAVLLGCVPLVTKERYSYEFFHEALNWTDLALFIPPAEMPRLLERLPSGAPRHASAEACARSGHALAWPSTLGFAHGRCSSARTRAHSRRAHPRPGETLLRMRRAGARLRRRLLWTSIYGDCHLDPAAAGEADAFDTLMEVLQRPRRHFEVRRRRPRVSPPQRRPAGLEAIAPNSRRFLRSCLPWYSKVTLQP